MLSHYHSAQHGGQKKEVWSVIEVGIPIKDDPRLAFETLQRVFELQNVSSIHISISQPKDREHEKFLALESYNSDRCNVRVTVHEEPLTLFANLRFLLDSCQSSWFSWICDDDNPSPNLYADFLEIIREYPEKALYVPQLSYRAFRRNPTSWGDAETPCQRSEKPWTLAAAPFEPPPHQMYGVWKREYLAQTMPRKGFDWFDHYLITVAMFENQIQHLPEYMMIIGHAPVRKVYATSHRQLTPLPWLQSVIRTLGICKAARHSFGLSAAFVGKLVDARRLSKRITA